ncbi:MAG: hypothetical protein R3C68_17070 [Myxococcota bacterium]
MSWLAGLSSGAGVVRGVRKAVLWGLGPLLVLFGAEVVLRLSGVGYVSYYAPDAECGVVLRPGAAGWFTQEGHAYLKISSQGLRDREYTVAKLPDTVRIAVLGDSYTMAPHVAVADTFVSVTQRHLQACSVLDARQVEVMNFGVGSYGTAQELQLFRTQVAAFNPDIVVLAFVTGDDVRNNSKALSDDPLVPYFVQSLVDDQLELDMSFRQEGAYQKRQNFVWRTLAASNYSNLLQVANAALNRARRPQPNMRQSTPLRGRMAPGKDISAINDLGADNQVYRVPETDEWRTAWEVTEGILRLFAKEVDAHGAEFRLITLSNAAQVWPELDKRADLAKGLGVEDLRYPDRRIRAFAQKERIPVLTLVDYLAEWAEKIISA